MATKLAPAHRELDGQPIKTGDVVRMPTRTRAGYRTLKRTRGRGYVREEKD